MSATPGELHAALAAAAVVPRGVRVDLARPPAGHDGEERAWQLCAGPPQEGDTVGGAGVDGSMLRVGSVAQALCVRAVSVALPMPEGAPSGGAIPEGRAASAAAAIPEGLAMEARLLIEVVQVSQIRLLRVSSALSAGTSDTSASVSTPVGPALHLPPNSGASPPALVCAAAYDALGRRLLPSVFSPGWLELSAWPPVAAALAPADPVSGFANGSCFHVCAGPELAAPTDTGTYAPRPILLAASRRHAPDSAATFANLNLASPPPAPSTTLPAPAAAAAKPMANVTSEDGGEIRVLGGAVGGEVDATLRMLLLTALALLLPLSGYQLKRWRDDAALARRAREEASRVNPRRDHPNVRSRASEGGPLSPRHDAPSFLR